MTLDRRDAAGRRAPRGTPTPEGVGRQAEMLANRVRKAFRHLHRRFEARQIGAFRLYDQDIPEIRAVIDWVEGHLVIAEYARQQTDAVPGWLEAMASAAAGALGVPEERVHLRRRRTRPAEGPRYGRLGEGGARVTVREGDLRFLVNLDDYVDIGLFPDHRETRARVRADAGGAGGAGGADVLNLFGYTGSFTVAAAAGGARATTTVDLSATYLEWARENLDLNGLAGPQHALVRDEASVFLEQARGEGRRYSLVVLDPPSFSTRGGGAAGDLDVQRDHRALVLSALAVMRPGGVLYFSTNHQRFRPDLEGIEAASIREITAETVPEDYRNRQVHRCFRIVA